ncbi:XTP/dITP diphosphatase [Candidatus Bathyarchaeota archaeon]|nr:XTP/dITP diphosphatase [Candidatus Bathyarchaeota archaeon]
MSRGRTIWMLTGNQNKFKEGRLTLSEFGYDLRLLRGEKIEIQAENLEEIAKHSLERISINDPRPIISEESGLFIERYGGFPGPYSSYTLRKIGLTGILKLMEGAEDRRAYYKSVIALKQGCDLRLFQGSVWGRISQEPRGEGGFGYDPIFIPDEGDGRTFGEMTIDEKNTISHRARAFRMLGAWLKSNPAR